MRRFAELSKAMQPTAATVHAFGQNANNGVLHFQMMTVFNTVADIARRLPRAFG